MSLFQFQRAYSASPFGERMGSESVPALPRRGYQTAYLLPKKHAYDAEMPQNAPQPRLTRRGVGGLGESTVGSQTLPTRMRGAVDQRDYVTVASQMPRYGSGSKPHQNDIPEAVSMHSQSDPRRRPIDSFRMISRPDDVFWSTQESHMYQNTSMLDPPFDKVDTRGQRIGPGSRHRPKDQQKPDVEGYPQHSTNSRAQEPPIPRRQWNLEDSNRNVSRDAPLEVEKGKSRFPPHFAQEEKRWQRE
ncbi:unnamed protein product [Rodentolepis nana]|uniref:Zasp-like motif domain-containing protein n=1 Tax=Rodentolepis nana TaxID=102285 RepID=A0A0R3TCR5_RODNA|nr:unnamed protein product [Rodentolepis nana]